MFKRLEKRRRRKQEEEELGLDENIKEVLGMNDTDSEESSTESEDSLEDIGSDNSPEQALSAGHSDGLEDIEDDGENNNARPHITVQEALRDPLYVVSLDPTVKVCIFCPGKLLKGGKMVDLHLTSNAHERRLKVFKHQTSMVNPKHDAWDIIREKVEKKPAPSLATPSETSKRVLKRKAHAALRKAKRDKHKAKTKSKKIAAKELPAAESDGMSSHPADQVPPRKKQKVATSSAPTLASATESIPETNNSASITSIVRSASTRAKIARARAVDTKKAKKGEAGMAQLKKSPPDETL